MHFYTLKLFGENIAAFAYTIFLLIFLLVVLIEAFIIFMLKYNLFKKAFVDSLLANLLSMTVATIILLIFFAENLPAYNSKNIIPVFGLALIGESIVLWFLNPGKPISKTVTVSSVMNFVTFIALYFSISLFSRGDS